MSSEPLTVAVCVATFRRRAGLARLLEGLAGQRVPPGWRMEVRVVENDLGSDPAEISVMAASIGLAVEIIVEPAAGVAHARNAALEHGPAEAFAFIDDDEVPVTGWLASLIDRLKAGPETVDAVIGPVIGRLPDGAPDWVRRGGFFDKIGPPRARVVNWRATRTSSAIVDGFWIVHLGFRFDTLLGRTGGEDVDLFRRLRAAGACIVHEPRALVYEDVEADRCSLRGLLRRRFRAGRIYGHLLTREGSRLGLARHARALLSGGRGGLEFIAGLGGVVLGRPERSIQGLLRIVVAAGAWRATVDTPAFIAYGDPAADAGAVT